MSEYSGRAWREGVWWVIVVCGVGVTQARTLDKVDHAARSLVADATGAGYETVTVSVEVDLSSEVAAQVEALRQQSEAAEEAAREAVEMQARLVASLTADVGLTGREVAAILKVTHGRVSQKRSNLPDPLLLVVSGRRPGHYLLNQAVQLAFLDRVDFSRQDEAGEALRIRPEGKASPVVLDPEFSSGVATVRGIRTRVHAGMVDAGQHVDDVAAEFDVAPDDVRAACAYEWRLHQVAAA